MAKNEDQVFEIPQELGTLTQYEIIRRLGSGGMGIVYLAENLLMGRRKEALKILNDFQLQNRHVKDRFLQEIAVAANLHHPHIVTSYATYQVGKLTVFAMEFVEGLDLETYVRKNGPLPVVAACAITRQVAAGLQYAHEMKTIHRDIKPANLMLAKSGSRDIVKILDFGLAKAQFEATQYGGLTASGTVMGTPHYMAPEQTLSAADVDIRADIYSLGCTLYHLLAGSPPFGGSVFEILRAHNEQSPKPISSIRSDIPSGLEVTLGKMLAKNPSERLSEPRQVVRELASFAKHGTSKQAVESPLVHVASAKPDSQSPLEQSISTVDTDRDLSKLKKDTIPVAANAEDSPNRFFRIPCKRLFQAIMRPPVNQNVWLVTLLTLYVLAFGINFVFSLYIGYDGLEVWPIYADHAESSSWVLPLQINCGFMGTLPFVLAIFGALSPKYIESRLLLSLSLVGILAFVAFWSWNVDDTLIGIASVIAVYCFTVLMLLQLRWGLGFRLQGEQGEARLLGVLDLWIRSARLYFLMELSFMCVAPVVALPSILCTWL